jgi:hypothetical protein
VISLPRLEGDESQDEVCELGLVSSGISCGNGRRIPHSPLGIRVAEGGMLTPV